MYIDPKNVTPENKKIMLEMFNKCLAANYTHIDNESADFAYSDEGDVLYIYLQWSCGDDDWANNFDFPAVPYSDMEPKWKCHRGFLRVWKVIEPELKDVIEDRKFKRIVIVGYSHGAALSVLCHEYVWFHRPDLREGYDIETFAFGCPRVYSGFWVRDELKERWRTLHVIRNQNDIVTHAPPILMKYCHVTQPIVIGMGVELIQHPTKYRPDCVLAHYDMNYRKSLSEEGK